MPLPDWRQQRRPLVRARVRRHTIKAITEVAGLKMEQDVIELSRTRPTASS